MRYLACLALFLFGCAAEEVLPSGDEPVAGSVAVSTQALTVKDCQTVVWSIGGGLAARFHSNPPYPGLYYTGYTTNAPVYIQGQSQSITTGFYDSSTKAKANLCARMSGQRIENRSTIPWKKLNLTTVVLVY
jgi:hypothetical protein